MLRDEEQKILNSLREYLKHYPERIHIFHEELHHLSDAGTPPGWRSLWKIISKLPLGTVITSYPQGEILAINEQALQLTGRDESYYLGRNFSDINIFSDKKLVNQIRKDVKKKQKATGYRISIRTEEGRNREIVGSSQVIEHRWQNFVLTVVNEVTELFETKSDLQLKDKALETAMNGVMIADLRGRIEYSNKAFKQMWLIDKHHSGTTFFDLWNLKEEAYRVFERMGESLLMQSSWQEEIQAKRSDGSVFHAVASMSIVPDENGEPNRILGSFIDITEQKDIEEELRIAKEKAEAATAAKSRFLANVSHEIRTPMNAVIGMSGLLLETALDNEQFEYTDSIRRNGEALLGLINDILDYSKIEAEMLEIENINFNIHELLEDIIQMFAFIAAKKNIDLHLIIDDSMPVEIRSDPTRHRQIITNLLSNAVKFTDKGEVVLSATAAETGDKVHITYKVKDTGIGIPAEKQNKLFKSFSQVDSSTSRRFGGTGLGLAISNSLARMMNGRIEVESEKNRGSTFTVYLEASHSGEPAPAEATDDFSGVKAYIIDNDPTNRKILTRYLKTLGLAIETVNDYTLLNEDSFSSDTVFFINHQPPTQNGFEAARYFFSMINRPKVVMMSSTEHEGRSSLQKNSDFAGILIKPLRLSMLVELLNNLFSRQSGAAAQKRHMPVKAEVRKDCRVLIAEDNPDNITLVEVFLKKWGIKPDVAQTGAGAVQLASENDYDLILMDVQMPVMDGLEATRRLRAAGNRVTILALTANASDEDRRACLEAGMNDFISKPIRAEQFHELMKKYISLQGVN